VVPPILRLETAAPGATLAHENRRGYTQAAFKAVGRTKGGG
jgi:hypothetical protein